MRLATFWTSTITAGMSGTHTSSTTAAGRLTGATAKKSVTGASTA